MTSEIRANTLKNRVGLGTISFTNTGAIVSGIVTATAFHGDGSNLTGITQTTINNNADNRIITGSGTANTLEGESTITYDNPTLEINTDTSPYGTLNLNGNSGGLVQFEDNEVTKWSIFGESTFSIYDNSNSSHRFRITSTGDVLFNDTTNSIYNDTSGGGFIFKSHGQLVLKKEASSVGDPLVWLNDTGQTTNKTIVLAQDGAEKGFVGLTGNSLSLGAGGSERLSITSAGEIKINTGSGTEGLQFQASSGANANLMGVGTNYGELGFFIGNSEKVRILSSGELRIISSGDNNDPAHLRLHCFDSSISINDRIGQIRFAGRDSGGSTVSRTGALIQATASNAWDTGQVSGYSATHLEFFTQNNSGTDTVAAGPRLRINSTGETTLLRINTFPNPNNTGSEILGSKLVFGNGIMFEERYPNGAYADRQDLVLRTNSGYGLGQSDKIRFTAGGQILIPGTQATSAQTGMLDIYHTAPAEINSPHIRLWGPTNQDARIEFGSETNVGEGGYISYNDADEGLYIGSRMAGYSEVKLCTGMNDGSPHSNERLTVNSVGRIGHYNTTNFNREAYTKGGTVYGGGAATGANNVNPGAFAFINKTPIRGDNSRYSFWIQTGDAYPNSSNFIDFTVQNAYMYRVLIKGSHSSVSAEMAMYVIYGLANNSGTLPPRIQEVSFNTPSFNGDHGGSGNTFAHNSGQFNCRVMGYGTSGGTRGSTGTYDTTLRIEYTGNNNQGLIAFIERWDTGT